MRCNSLIEAPFTFDAGPPIIAIKYSFYKYYLGCDKFKDMDGALYKFLDYNLEAYNHLLYLSGGMTFSYPFTARVPFNIIPFEDLYSVELLIAIIFKCKLRSNGMPVPLLRNCYSIFNGTKYR